MNFSKLNSILYTCICSVILIIITVSLIFFGKDIYRRKTLILQNQQQIEKNLESKSTFYTILEKFGLLPRIIQKFLQFSFLFSNMKKITIHCLKKSVRKKQNFKTSWHLISPTRQKNNLIPSVTRQSKIRFCFKLMKNFQWEKSKNFILKSF